MVQYDLNFNLPWNWPKSWTVTPAGQVKDYWAEIINNTGTIPTTDLVQEGIANGVKLLHCTEDSPYKDRFNGVTIAYRRVTNTKGNRMVDAAVAYCSVHDTFVKKTGAKLAMEKFCKGHTVTVPVRENNCDVTMIDNLRTMFWSPYPRW